MSVKPALIKFCNTPSVASVQGVSFVVWCVCAYFACVRVAELALAHPWRLILCLQLTGDIFSPGGIRGRTLEVLLWKMDPLSLSCTHTKAHKHTHKHGHIHTGELVCQLATSVYWFMEIRLWQQTAADMFLTIA